MENKGITFLDNIMVGPHELQEAIDWIFGTIGHQQHIIITEANCVHSSIPIPNMNLNNY
jgi:hypothetical protein